MTYAVKTIFGPTLQGEGPHAGAPCVFVRLAGCNAWDGRPETRATSACPYCDTDFRGGEQMTAEHIVQQATALVPAATTPKDYGCVLSGGEPLLQADEALLIALGHAFAWVDVETNGTRPSPHRPSNVQVVCSPKAIAGQPIVIAPDAWKILIPAQQEFLDQATASGQPVFVQPVCPDTGPSGADYQSNLATCIDLCQSHGYRLSLQLHKYLGIE